MVKVESTDTCPSIIAEKVGLRTHFYRHLPRHSRIKVAEQRLKKHFCEQKTALDIKRKAADWAGELIKDRFMENNIHSERNKHAETIIRNHILWSMGASFLIPVPIADIFAVSALQLDMIRQLCRVYNVDFAETQGKAVVTSLTSSTLAKVGARSLIKIIPGIGQLIGGVATSVFNGASTYALGEVFKKHFESGGTILDFDTDRLKKFYQEKFEKGKKVAEQLKKDQAAKKAAENAAPAAASGPSAPPTAAAEPSAMDRLRELAELKNQGIISDEEFEQMKKRIIESF